MPRQTKDKRAEKVKLKRQKVRVHNKISSPANPWDGIWYNKQDGAKVRVNEAIPDKPYPFTPTMKMPIRTVNHPGVYVRIKNQVIHCDVQFLKEKFTRVPTRRMPKLEDAK